MLRLLGTKWRQERSSRKHVANLAPEMFSSFNHIINEIIVAFVLNVAIKHLDMVLWKFLLGTLGEPGLLTLHKVPLSGSTGLPSPAEGNSPL